MDLRNFYESIGVSYDTVLRRLRKETLIEKYLNMFMQDPSFAQLKADKDKGDYEEMFRTVHTLKGLALNLELTPLAEAASDLTELLRNGNPNNSTIVDEKYQKLMTEYENIRNLLQ